MGISLYRRVALAAVVALGVPGAPAAGEAAPAVITGRVLASDPAAPTGEAWYLVEVGEIRHGGVAGSVVQVRLAPGDRVGRRLAAEALATGGPVVLELLPAGGGSYRAAAVRAVGRSRVDDPLPPPLAEERAVPGPAAGDRPRSTTAAATAGAPFEHQVLELVNEERLAAGNLPPLKGVGLLDGSAETHSSNMATRDFFAHCDPDTLTQPWDRMTAAGYSWNAAAENIAGGQATPQEVMTAWMGSDGHRANILSTWFRELGVGYVAQSGDLGTVRRDLAAPFCQADSFNHGPYVRYWTQNFGRRNAVFPVVIERELYETACSAVDLYTYGTGWALEMRFSNDGSTWSAWEPFTPTKSWSLAPTASGSATVFAELRNGGTVRAASDTIGLTDDYPAAASYDLAMDTVTGTEGWVACDWIRAGDGFRVAATGDVTFTAPRIILAAGFSVAPGGTFRAVSP